MEELEACPFCGGEAAQRDFTEPFVNGWVGCQKCHCFINWIKGGKSEAVAAWNRRAAPENKALTITFPCKIGEPVWMVGTVSRRDTKYTPYEYVPAVSTGFVREYGVYTGHWGAIVETKGGSFCYLLSDFGKTIFTDQAAAEQALAARRPEATP